MSPRRAPRRLDRRQGRRQPRERVLIVCEGEVTEVEYFKQLRSYLRSLPVDVARCEIQGRGRDPRSVVEYAVTRLEQSRNAARRGDIPYDQVWCVVDMDDHATLREALTLANRRGIRVAVSAPCFELWLLYHFDEQRDPIRRRELPSKLCQYIPSYDKRIPADFPFASHEHARQRALRASPDHSSPNRQGSNPSTNVWLVVDVIRASGRGR